MNSVIEYVLTNKVNICVVGLNYDQANNTKNDIIDKIFDINMDSLIFETTPTLIKFQNDSTIRFLSSHTKSQYIRGFRFNLLLFNMNVYERKPIFLVSSEKIGILSY